MNPIPKHQLIFEALHSEIVQGKHSPGSLIPSEEALCRRWNVSRPTVARALKDLQILGLVERRAGSGTYVRSDIRATRPVLGLFVEGLGKTEILDPICAEITRYSQERGCGVFSGVLSQELPPQKIAEEWAKNGIRGVFFAPLEHHENRESFNSEVSKAFSKAGMSVVLVDRDITEYPQRSNYDLVTMDSFQAGCELGIHMAKSGCKKIAFLAKPLFPNTTDLRIAGVREGLRLMNIPDLDLIVEDTQDAAFPERFFKKKPPYDGIVCSNDLTAAQFLQGATQKKFQVPGDFKLAGFDDIHYSTLLSVPLTTVRQPCRSIGIACVDTMLSRLERPLLPPRLINLKGELMTRASTKN